MPRSINNREDLGRGGNPRNYGLIILGLAVGEAEKEYLHIQKSRDARGEDVVA